MRRVYIEKPGKNEKRPLSIPAMIDRAQQALYLLTLAPIAETRADKTSFGFGNEDRKHNFVRYADDFIVIVKDEGTAQETIGIINSFLVIRGLRLSETKTKITHITENFDFLGWNFRKYRNGHLVI